MGSGAFQGLYSKRLLAASALRLRRNLRCESGAVLGIFCNGADDALVRSKVASINEATLFRPWSSLVSPSVFE